MSQASTTFTAKRLTRGFLSFLKKSDYLSLLPQIARETSRHSRTNLDPNLARIESAVNLTSTQRQTLSQSLDHLFGRSLSTAFSVNSHLIAGLKIKVGDQDIDQSLLTQINQLGLKLNL